MKLEDNQEIINVINMLQTTKYSRDYGISLLTVEWIFGPLIQEDFYHAY
jgi:hypothetical protein